MRIILLILSFFGILFITSCSPQKNPAVYNQRGIQVGEIQIENEKEATIIDIYNQVRGRIRGAVVRDESGGRVGEVTIEGNKAIITDTMARQIGSYENGTCYGPNDAPLGRVSSINDSKAASAGCLLLLILKELPAV